VDAALEDEAARRRAALPVVPNAPHSTPFEREVEVGVVEHDLRVLAAHLEREALVRRPHASPTSEPVSVEPVNETPPRRVRDDGRADVALAVHELDDLGREPGLEHDLDEHVPVCGTSSAGLNTHAFPHTSAGNIFHVGMASGKLNGVMMPHTPIGRRYGHRPLVAQLARHGVPNSRRPSTAA
jgi:hypothetical protein